MKSTIQFVLLSVLLVIVVILAKDERDRKFKPLNEDQRKAQAQVRRIAEELDKRTTETGVYVRPKEDELQEFDPWNSKIQIAYSQGGVSEMIIVRSAGPDRVFHTPDDLGARGMSMNMKGVGNGIKMNAEETSFNASKGVIKGAVEGAKETVRQALPFKKKLKTDSDA